MTTEERIINDKKYSVEFNENTGEFTVFLVEELPVSEIEKIIFGDDIGPVLFVFPITAGKVTNLENVNDERLKISFITQFIDKVFESLEESETSKKLEEKI